MIEYSIKPTGVNIFFSPLSVAIQFLTMGRQAPSPAIVVLRDADERGGYSSRKILGRCPAEEPPLQARE